MFLVEVTHPYAPDDHLDQRWQCPDAESAAMRFESEAEPGNWPVEEIVDELAALSTASPPLEYENPDTGVTVTAQRAEMAVRHVCGDPRCLDPEHMRIGLL